MRLIRINLIGKEKANKEVLAVRKKARIIYFCTMKKILRKIYPKQLYSKNLPEKQIKILR